MKLLPNLAIGRTRLAVLDFTVLYTFPLLTCLPGEADSLVLLTPGGHHPLLVLLTPGGHHPLLLLLTPGGHHPLLLLLTPGGHHPLLVLLHRQDLQSLLLISQQKMNNFFFPRRAT